MTASMQNATGIMETMAEAILRLREAGFEFDLSAVEAGRLRCGACQVRSPAANVTVRHTVRFEGESDPDDEAILIAIVMPCGHAGLFTAAYGCAIEAFASDVLQAL